MYYIYSCNEEQLYTATRAELYNFVNNKGKVFGNFPQQRRLIKKIEYPWNYPELVTKGMGFIEYIAYDEYYNLIDYKVLEDWASNSCKQYKQFSRNNYGDHEYRNGPVPGTGGWKNGHYFRRPKTRNELKANCDPDHKEYVRKGRWVPSSWDDIPVSADRIKRSWKKQKKRKQWM